MLAHADRGLRAVFARLSDLGSERVPADHVRMVQGANHFFLLSIVTNTPLVLLIAMGSWPQTLSPAVSHGAMIVAWLVAVFLNSRGHLTAANVVGVGLPVVQFGYLAALFSDEALFQLQMLLLGGLVYVVFVPTRWGWGLFASLLGVAAAVTIVVHPLFAEPKIEVAQWWLLTANVYNIVQAALFVFLIGFFNNGYLQRERRRASALLDEARQLAVTDALTGLYNRRGIEPELQAVQETGDCCLAILDIDRFKQVNDRLGHQVGDEVLSEVAATLRRSVPRSVALARWGGEEFLALMPGMPLPEALIHLENARAAVDRTVTAGGERQQVTVSAGVVRVEHPVVVDIVLARADAQLYEAKREGRNTVRGVSLRERSARRLPEGAIEHGPAGD